MAHRRMARDDPVVLSFGAAPDGSFAVTVSDAGPGFEPISPRATEDRDWTAEGGLGVTIIRNLADDVRLLRGEGMQVNLRFAVALDPDSA
jgi:anti-sigma regulatory factor (Ser/Thr protein kinase)